MSDNNTGKVVHLHMYKTGRVIRYAYYSDLRAVSCARALLEKSAKGWINTPIKKVPLASNYYLRSTIIPPKRRKKR